MSKLRGLGFNLRGSWQDCISGGLEVAAVGTTSCSQERWGSQDFQKDLSLDSQTRTRT